MIDLPVRPIDGRFWRLLSIAYQRQPLASGSHLTGGRWNRVGTRALYLAAEHATAIAEFHQDLPRPGTLVSYDVESAKIVDLTDTYVRRLVAADQAVMTCPWKAIHLIEGRDPP